MWLLIDDVRDLNTDTIARTPEAGQRLLASGPWASRVRHQTLQVIDLLEVATLNCHYSNVI